MVQSGYLRYKYTVAIDLEDLADRIIKKLSPYVDEYEVDSDYETLLLKCTDMAFYKLYKTPATILDPPDEDLVFESIDNADVNIAVLEALQETKKIKVTVDIDKDYDYLEG